MDHRLWNCEYSSNHSKYLVSCKLQVVTPHLFWNSMVPIGYVAPRNTAVKDTVMEIIQGVDSLLRSCEYFVESCDGAHMENDILWGYEVNSPKGSMQHVRFIGKPDILPSITYYHDEHGYKSRSQLPGQLSLSNNFSHCKTQYDQVNMPSMGIPPPKNIRC